MKTLFLILVCLALVGCASDAQISQKAQAAGDLALCGDINNLFTRNQCYHAIAENTDDVAGCAYIEDNAQDPGITKDSCISIIAGHLRDVGLCQKISAAAQPACKANIAIALANSTMCTSSDKQIMSHCIMQIAINTRNIALCSQVGTTEPFTMELCISEVRKFTGEPGETICTAEQKATQACTKEYVPVCGWNDPEKIQCIRYPCASTYGNKCEACASENVISWTPGECPN